MKNIKVMLTLALVILMALALVACAPKADPDPKPADVTEAPTEPADNTEAAAADHKGEPFSNAFDMAVIINGKTYPVRVDSAEVLAALGDGYEYGETVSCVYDGYDKTFTYDGIVVSTVPVDGKDVIEMFTITGPAYTTTRNITVGATRDEVIEAYGENYFADGYLTYTESGSEENISEMRIQFLFDDDTLSEIYIYSPSYSN